MIGRRKDEWEEEYRYWQKVKKAKEDKRSITERILSQKIEQPVIIKEVVKEVRVGAINENETKDSELREPKIKRHKNYRKIIAERIAEREKSEKTSKEIEEIEKIDIG